MMATDLKECHLKGYLFATKNFHVVSINMSNLKIDVVIVI